MSDLISRQDAIKIVDQFSREEMFHYMESLELDVRATQICHSAIEAVGTIKEQIESLPSAEPKTDGVLKQVRRERDVALKTLEEHGIGFAEKPKTGEWVMLERDENVHDIHGVPTWGINYMCDKCGFITTAIQDHFSQYKFCPNCGSYNGGEEE